MQVMHRKHHLNAFIEAEDNGGVLVFGLALAHDDSKNLAVFAHRVARKSDSVTPLNNQRYSFRT